ncbi:MAG: ATP-dependent RNA helicase [Patescibacteria group bacterium]
MLGKDTSENLTKKNNSAEAGRSAQPENLASSDLPMDNYRQEIIETIDQNDSSVIIGETGSGKTTRVPVFLMEQYPDKKIAVTQPRRLAARSVAKYVAEEGNYRLGEEVGFQIRFDNETNPQTRLNFQTDGILLKKLQNDRLLREYDIVMVDEAHERSINIDIVLGLLKAAQRGRATAGLPPLKVIVASATIEKEKFAEFFDQSPVIEVPGRAFEVKVEYEQRPVQDYHGAAAAKVEQIVADGKPGDILIFMPGEEDINRTIGRISELKIDNIDVMPLYGSMAPEDQDRIFEKNSKRKVIVATNIAETSITIDGIVHVIDSGLIKQKRFDPATGIAGLGVEEHAQSGCDQRKGRAGRTAPGYCYRLYTEEEFQKRQKFQLPEISRSNLDQVILYMKSIGIDKIEDFDFIDPPAKETIIHGLAKLNILGALDEAGKITRDGKLMAELPLSPEKSRMVLESRKYHCVGKVATIAAMQGERSVFIRPRDPEEQLKAKAAQAKFVDNNSDFLTLLNVWEGWSQAGFDSQWAYNNFLNVRQLREVQQVRSQLFTELVRNGVRVDDANGDDREAIQKCITSGMIDRLMAQAGFHAYQPVFDTSSNPSADNCYIHPASAVFNHEPKFIIGDNVVKTSKIFIRACQAVNSDWLIETVPYLLDEKGKKLDYDTKSGEVKEYADYEIKGGKGLRFKYDRPAAKNAEAAEIFAAAVADGRVETPYYYANETAVRELRQLNRRTGGLAAVPDLSDWYKAKLRGAISKTDPAADGGDLKININDFCPLDSTTIERLYPLLISIKGQAVEVAYEYAPARTDYFSHPVPEEYCAKLRLSHGLAEQLAESDLPQIGEGGRPQIKLIVGDMYSLRSYDSFAEMKTDLDKQKSYEQPRVEPVKISPFIMSRLSPSSDPYPSINPADLGGSIGAGVFAEKLLASKHKKPEEKEEEKNPTTTPEKEKPAEPEAEKEREILTEELRSNFAEELVNARLFLDIAASIREPEYKGGPEIAKIQKLKEKIKEIKKDLGLLEKELRNADNTDRMRSKVAELVKKAENAAQQSARLAGQKDGWIKDYRHYLLTIKKMAQDNEVELSAEGLGKIRSKAAALAQRILAEPDVEIELENIFVDSI